MSLINTRDVSLDLSSTAPEKKSAASKIEIIFETSPKLEATWNPILVPDAPVGSSFITDDEVGRPPVTLSRKRHAVAGRSPSKISGSAKTPGKSRTKNPRKSPSMIYIGSFAKTSGRSKAKTTGKSPSVTYIEIPAKTSGISKINTPESSQAMTQDRSPAKDSVINKIKTPGSSRASTPDSSPAKTSGKNKIKTPGSSQATTLDRSPAKTSVINKINTPGSSRASTPDRSPAKTSGISKIKTPESSQAMTPDRSPAKTHDKSPTNTPGKSPSKSLRRRLCFENSDSGSESNSTNTDGEDEWGAYCTRSVNTHQFIQQVSEDELLASEVLFDQEVFEGVILSDKDVTIETVDETTGANAPKNIEGLKFSNTFSFTKDFSTFTGQPEVYLNTPGSRLTVKDPTGLFLTVWDTKIIEHIVKETNNYAWQTISKLSETDQTIPTYLTEWRETTFEEIYRLFALLNYMSIDIRSSLSEYWSTGILGMSEFRKIMSRNRFILLTKFLHFVDNNTLQKRSYDRKISKIAPILDHCNRKFSSMYTPHRSLSLDESLLLWKGRISFAQTIRTKAARFGIKSYELCESKSGYLLRTLLYAGKNSSTRDEAIDGFENPTAKVVLELMDDFLDVGHMLVMDSWYNKLCLTRYLKKRHTDVVGTINRRRVEVPLAIKDLVEKRMQPGEQVSLHCGDITMIAWKDVRLVTAISTFHKPDLIASYRNGLPFNKPKIIECYNKNMGGVDMKDQKLSMYLFERKRMGKWYMKVFRRLLNTSILNVYIIHSSCDDSVENPKCHHREFRYRVSEGLLAAFKEVRIPKHFLNRKIRSSHPVDKIRLKRDAEHDHFPVPTEEKKEGVQRHKGRRCAYCSSQGKRATCTTECRTCDVGLCIGCWVDYHTKPDLNPTTSLNRKKLKSKE